MRVYGRHPGRIVATLLISVLWLLSVSMAHAGEHDEARHLLESGKILSLETILKNIKPQYAGKVLEVHLEKEHEGVVYEMEILGDDGVVYEIKVDARSGKILSAGDED